MRKQGFGRVMVFTLVVVSLMALALPSIVSAVTGVSGGRSAELSAQNSGILLKSSDSNCEVCVTSTLTVVENK